MANKKITDLTLGTRFKTTDLIETSQDIGGTPISRKIPAELVCPSPDLPPATTNAMDDEFDGTSLDVKWSWRNQGSATITFGNSRAVIRAVAVGADDMKMIEQVCPANPWAFTARLSPEYATIPANSILGIVGLQTSTGRLVVAGTQQSGSGNICGAYYNSVTSVNTVFGAISYGQNPFYIRLADDGVNLIWSFSRNGTLFHTYQTLGRTAFLTGSIDRIGIGVASENASNFSAIDCDWFRRTT